VQQVDLGGGHRPPLVRVDAELAVALAGDHGGLELLGPLDLRPDHRLHEHVPLLWRGRALELRQEHGAGRQGRGEAAVLAGPEGAVGQHAGDQLALERGQLLDARDRHESAHGLRQVLVRDAAGQLAVGVEQVRHGGVVVVERAGGADAALGHVAAQAGQAVQAPERRGERADVQLVHAAAVGVGGAVGGGLLRPQRLRVRRGAALLEEAAHQAALPLKLVGERGAAQREFGELGHPVGLAARGDPGVDAQCAEHGACEHRKDQDHRYFRPDRKSVQQTIHPLVGPRVPHAIAAARARFITLRRCSIGGLGGVDGGEGVFCGLRARCRKASPKRLTG
jgi:hypothetical protein